MFVQRGAAADRDFFNNDVSLRTSGWSERTGRSPRIFSQAGSARAASEECDVRGYPESCGVGVAWLRPVQSPAVVPAEAGKRERLAGDGFHSLSVVPMRTPAGVAQRERSPRIRRNAGRACVESAHPISTASAESG